MLQVTRFKEAIPYEAKKHFGMTAMRIHGQGVSDLEDYWVGISTFLPGGGAQRGAAPSAKVYVVLEGKITVTTTSGDAILGRYDSCYLPPNLERSIENKTNHSVHMLVISPN